MGTNTGNNIEPVMHLPIKFGADIFIQSGVIDMFKVYHSYKLGTKRQHT